MKELIPVEVIENRVLIIRGQKVMMDRDLAELYGVSTKQLNQQVRRNHKRFPKEFVFRLTKRETEELVTNWNRFKTLKHSTSLPYAFTEHGVAMLASVLNSPLAIKMSIYIIKVFVKLREMISTHKELAHQLGQLERRIERHDGEMQEIFEALRRLMTEPTKPKRRIGFHSD